MTLQGTFDLITGLLFDFDFDFDFYTFARLLSPWLVVPSLFIFVWLICFFEFIKAADPRLEIIACDIFVDWFVEEAPWALVYTT